MDKDERSFWNRIGWMECIPTPELILIEVADVLVTPLPVLVVDPFPVDVDVVDADDVSEDDNIEPVCGSNICIDELEEDEDDDDDCRIDGDLLVVMTHMCSVVLYLLLMVY